MSRESNVAARAASSVARKALPAGTGNKFTETPGSPEFGQLIAAQESENTGISRIEGDSAARFSDHEANHSRLFLDRVGLPANRTFPANGRISPPGSSVPVTAVTAAIVCS